MFAIRMIARNVSRHKYKSILHILIGVLTVLILDIYAGNMDSTGEQLAKLPEVLEVPAKISVLNGSMTEGMTIREDRMMGVRESAYVKDPVFTVRMKFGLGAFTAEEYKDNLNYYGMGINAVAGVPGMKREEITFLEGVDESVLETTQKVCILDADLMEENGLRLGEDVMLTIFYYRYALDGSEIFSEPLTTDTYRIVGQVEIEDYRGGWVPPEAILPLDCVRDAYHSQGIDFYADSGSFVVKDPFQLNALKEEMYHDAAFLPVITRAEYRYDGNALTIMDETFIRSAEALQGNLALLRGDAAICCGDRYFYRVSLQLSVFAEQTGRVCPHALSGDRSGQELFPALRRDGACGGRGLSFGKLYGARFLEDEGGGAGPGGRAVLSGFSGGDGGCAFSALQA